MAIAHVNGINIWYEENGAGDPVIQLHGSGFGHQNFAAATPRLAKHFRVIDFDLRGYGQSDQPIQHYDMEVWADDTAGLMDALSIAKAHIHGTSMGANIAQQFAAKYSDRVDRLILNCGAAKLDAAGILVRKNLIDIAETMGCGSRTLAEMIAFQALSRRFLDSEQGQGAVDAIQDILDRSNRVEIFKRACGAVIDMDLRPLLDKIVAPTLVIGGDQDIMTPWQPGPSGAGQEYLVRHIKGATKYVIKGAGHSTLVDAPEENCRVVIDFLMGKDVANPLSTEGL
jgi:pimeloyl-ACP methyl ester carboxylesterase